MKKIFGRKKLKKSKSDQQEKPNENCVVNGTNLATSGTFCRTTNDFKESTTLDECHSCYDATSSSVGEERHFDEELDKHMMQTIADVKYVKKRPKFVAVGEVNFQRECLDAHNVVRARYGCQPLIWSQELCDLAHSWAVKLAERGRILFPELQGIGENIRLTIVDEQTHLPSGTEITEIWASEAEHFDFEKPRWNPKTQHFTQIVWKETSEMGIARQWNTTTNCVATVAMYRPSGNSNAPGNKSSTIAGEFQVNIPPKVYFDEIPVSPNIATHCAAPTLRQATTAQESVPQNLPSSSEKS
uniref:SCP domain-containing protein n=1 Tax=Setaria digitata TaxID=48799 RepID=A0A915PMG6_9BILA